MIARDVITVTSILDGERYEGKERFLSRGVHTLVQTSTGDNLVVLRRRPSIATSDRSSLSNDDDSRSAHSLVGQITGKNCLTKILD
jgi:hypothetical protein